MNTCTALKIKAQATIILLIGLVLGRPATGNVAEADNTQTFEAVCDLFQLAEGKLPDDVSLEDGATEIKKLQAINMSLAPKTWSGMFTKGAFEPQSWDEATTAGLKPDQKWKNNWAEWQAAVIDTNPANEPGKSIASSHFPKLTGQAAKLAQVCIATILGKARMHQKAIEDTKNSLKTLSNVDLMKKMNEAAYGVETGKGTFDASGPVATGNGVVAQCDTDGTVDTKQSLAYAMQCLCFDASQSTGTKACRKDRADTQGWDTAPRNLQTAFTEVRALCLPGGSKKVTAPAIRSAVNRIHSSIKMISDVGYLGAYVTTGCTATVANGFCVKYNTKIKTDSDKFGELTYVANMLHVADALEQREDGSKRAHSAMQAIKSEVETAWLISNETLALQDLTSAVKTAATTSSQAQTKKTKRNKKNVKILKNQLSAKTMETANGTELIKKVEITAN
uniref:Variant surface glycoprotein 1214 n=1 Tax=Trypanosoma brucei TaxID=5691 RepID=M4SZL7_9TRYP|nr:variant surface glycoprotein 1214 [Trypanosoma brucei]